MARRRSRSTRTSIEFSELIKKEQLDCGLWLPDGDAVDRIGLWGCRGEFVDSAPLSPVAIHYLVKYKKFYRARCAGPVATLKVKKMRSHYGLEYLVIIRRFKWILRHHDHRGRAAGRRGERWHRDQRPHP